MAMSFGLTWGGVLVLFYNGVIPAPSPPIMLPTAGRLLLGWLLPHGAVEIPCILLGGQALAGALIGWGERRTRTERLREVAPDLLALAAGAGVLLVWAGLVEAFISQYHQPVLPYSVKISFGLVESIALWFYLYRVGR
jgi:uncharacterized membrane protein SpoIIM required for sporulation